MRETSDHPLIATFAERLENFSDDAERMRFLAENGPSWDGAEALAVADEVVRENPEFAEIPEERRRELLAEVLGRTRQEGAQ